MVVLNDELVKAKTKVDNLLDVKNLNVCGQGIDDVSILQQAPNIEVLSLSVNKISSLRHFVFCNQLKQLYLRANAVTDLGEIRYLMSLPQLRVLWLADNPCSKLPHYRAFVVANLPNLENLDNLCVCDADRHAAKNMRTLQPSTAADVLAMELEAARQREQQQQRQAEEQAGSTTPPHTSPRQHRSPRLSVTQVSGGHRALTPRAGSASPEPSSHQQAADGSSPRGATSTLSRANSGRRNSLTTGNSTGMPPVSPVPPASSAAAVSTQQAAGAPLVLSARSSPYRASPEPACVDLGMTQQQQQQQQQRALSTTPRDLGRGGCAGVNITAGGASDVLLPRQQQQLFSAEHSCCGHMQHQQEHCCHCHAPRQQQHLHTQGRCTPDHALAAPGAHSTCGGASSITLATSTGSPAAVAAAASSRTSILYAVMALLGELDASGLSIVQREVHLRLLEHQQ